MTERPVYTMPGSIPFSDDELPPVLTVAEAATFMRVGKNTMYLAIQRGDVPSLKLGRRTLVPRDGLLRMLGSGETGG